MRAGVIEGAVGLAVTSLLVYESRHNTVPWELVGGLVAITAALAATRRFPLLSLVVAVLSGVAMLFDYGGRVPVWPLLLMAGTVYLTRRHQMQRRAEELATQARLKERARIAADMHDSLGHELTLIAVRAGVLQMTGGLDERQRAAAGELRESAAAATERLREIIEVLRDPDSIPDLIARSAAAGMTIRSTVERLPADLEPVAYRVVREGLTNAAKHAPDAAVVVEVTGRQVSVVNGPAAGNAGLASGGIGLAGLRERVERAGGAFEAGPADGGFAVRARFKGVA
jgi:signal transduction histidine kinase